MSVRDHYSEDDIIVHQISKEDRDLILEYNIIDKRDVPKVDFLRVKIDNLSSRNELVVKIMEMTSKPGNYQIFGVDPYKIMYLRGKVSFRRVLNKADIVYAAAGGIRWSSKLMHIPIETWISPISLVVDLIRLSEVKNMPIFFLGGKPEIIEKAYFNLKKSFPKMRVVGRHTSNFSIERERDIIEVIRKTSPKILFVGMGFPEDIMWMDKNRKHFNNTVVIGIDYCLDIISGKVKKAPDYFQNKGLTWFYQIISRPHRLIAWFRLFKFGLFSYFFHLFGRRKKRKA